MMEHDTTASKIPMLPIVLSHHARIRQQQRCITSDEIRLVLLWGRIYSQGNGRFAFFLGQKEIKRASKEGIQLQSLKGISVIESSDGEVITVIRCQSPSRIKKKRTTSYHFFQNQKGGKL